MLYSPPLFLAPPNLVHLGRARLQLVDSCLLVAMKKESTTPTNWPRRFWRSIAGINRRGHDPLLVYSMAAFNFESGWKQLLLKHQFQVAAD